MQFYDVFLSIYNAMRYLVDPKVIIDIEKLFTAINNENK